MLFRVDFEHFVAHMIDYFPREILINMHYVLISAGVRNQGRLRNVIKVPALYPSVESITDYSQFQNMDVFRKQYMEELEESKLTIYSSLIETAMKHFDIVIVCKKSENFYIDILAEYIEKEFSLPCINLNKLFGDGRLESVTVNLDKIKNKLVDVRRIAARSMMRHLEATEDGRAQLITKMSKKDKIRKLKDIGIEVTSSDYDKLDALLEEAWVND